MPDRPTPPASSPPDPAEVAARDQLVAFVADLDATRQRLREGAERSLNAYFATQTPKSLQAKNQVTAVIAWMLGRMGMAIEHDGRPCSFSTLSGTKDRNGRFRLVPHGSCQYVALSSRLEDFLPLRLMDAAPAMDLTVAATETPPSPKLWQDRITPPAAEAERQ